MKQTRCIKLNNDQISPKEDTTKQEYRVVPCDSLSSQFKPSSTSTVSNSFQMTDPLSRYLAERAKKLPETDVTIAGTVTDIVKTMVSVISLEMFHKNPLQSKDNSRSNVSRQKKPCGNHLNISKVVASSCHSFDLKPQSKQTVMKKIKVLKSHLAVPITDKCTVTSQNDEWRVCVGYMQGWRKRMEDAHTVLLEAPNDPTASFFGVFDGHGGSNVSRFISRHLHKFIIQQDLFLNGHIEDAIKAGFLAIDEFMFTKNVASMSQGSTATIVLIKNKIVYCGNVGDSRAIAVIDGRVIKLSNDHKPKNKNEFRRITRAGLKVVKNRINGSLNMSRALGDFRYKRVSGISLMEQPVLALPEVISRKLNDKWEFIVIASDGIWDVFPNYAVANFIKERIKKSVELSNICCELMSECLSQCKRMPPFKGCDNMTITIILLSESQAKSSILQNRTVRKKSEHRTSHRKSCENSKC